MKKNERPFTLTRNYTALLGLQAFSPSNSVIGKGRVPLEVLIDLKCESGEFERLVPQTDAMFHYDKFNRLRLRSIVNSAVMRTSKDSSSTDLSKTSHLRDETVNGHISRSIIIKLTTLLTGFDKNSHTPIHRLGQRQTFSIHSSDRLGAPTLLRCCP